MKNKNHLIVFIIALMFVLSCASISSAETLYKGKCGKNLKWALDDQATLTISGKGSMKNYDITSNRAPWRRYLVKKIIIKKGITHIGSAAFYNSTEIEGTLELPSTVTSIGNYAFYNCHNLTGELKLPKKLKTIGSHAFHNCTGFTGSLELGKKSRILELVHLSTLVLLVQ